jgi:hypothetical protein
MFKDYDDDRAGSDDVRFVFFLFSYHDSYNTSIMLVG